MKKEKLSFNTLLAVISFSIAGSVIYELPYIKYVYYDKLLPAFGMTNAQAGFLCYFFFLSRLEKIASFFYFMRGFFFSRFSISAKKNGKFLIFCKVRAR